MDFSAMFQTWMNVLTKPGEAIFAAERSKPNATLTTGIIWVVIAGVIAAIFGAIGAVVDSFVGLGFNEVILQQLPPEAAAQFGTFDAGGTLAGGVVGSFCAILLVPIGFLISAAIYFGLAKVVGGTGNFDEHTYVLATFNAPILIINSVIGVVPFLGECVSFLLFIYQIVLVYFSMKVVHDLTTGKALFVALILPVLIILCLICVFGVAFTSLIGVAAGAQ